MKNSKIHIGLENSHLRDFLAISIIKNYENDFANKKIYVDRTKTQDAFEWAIKDCENEVEFHKKRLMLLQERQAIITMIKMLGWTEFDVSDITERDLEYRLPMSFIGTQSEYNNFLTTL